MRKLICILLFTITLCGCYQSPRYKDNSAYGDFSRSMHREHNKQLINLTKEMHKQVHHYIRHLGYKAWQQQS